MKLPVILLCLFAAFSAFADESCLPVARYKIVSPVSFDRLDLRSAIDRLLVETPLKTQSDVNLPSTPLSAKEVSGPLDGVLNKMGKSAGFVYRQDNCDLIVSMLDKNGKVIASAWSLTAGHTISHDLDDWGKASGWNVVWQLSRDWTIPASTEFSGSFSSAVTEVIKTLASNGALIHAQFFNGNRTVLISGHGAAE